jgi:branched-chain amino acid transport system ATP-binding protein
MALGRREHRQESRRRELASRVLEVLRLEHTADVPVRDLPYGVRKTLEIGCALVSRPRLLLLDEPAAGASHREVGELAEVILALPRELGIGVLVIEHHVPLVKQVAENITVLNFGEVLACGPPSDIVSHPAVLEAYLGHAAKAMAAAPPSGRRRTATAAGRARSTAAVFDPYPTGSDANESQPSQTPQLALASVSAGYDGVPVLRDLDLTVAKGQFAVVLGSNGAGKTTLLRTIMGQTHVTQGDVVVAGRSLLGLPAAKIVRAGVALAPEGRQLFAGLTVEDNLRAGALARSERHGAAGDPAAMVYDVFPRLAERRTQVAGTLSGGEQQMLAIGRALMSRPELLLIDEASLGLAPVMVESVFGLITRINGTGITVLAVEQNVAVVEHADVVFVLERGQVAFGGPTATVRDRLRDEVLTAYLGQEET